MIFVWTLLIVSYAYMTSAIHRAGRRGGTPFWISLGFALIWPISLTLAMGLGALGAYDDDEEELEE